MPLGWLLQVWPSSFYVITRPPSPTTQIACDVAATPFHHSSLMNRGSADPVLASVWAMKLAPVLLHEAVQRGLLGAVPLVVDRGAIRRPLRMPADGLHARLPRC